MTLYFINDKSIKLSTYPPHHLLAYHSTFFMYGDDRRAYADKKTTNDVCSHKHLHLEQKKACFYKLALGASSLHFIS